MNKKLCFSMYVAGERYAGYIPFFLYFIAKSYPEYFTLISYKTELPFLVKEDIERINGNFKIKENIFRDFPDNVSTSKTLRRVMIPPEYKEFDYIYVGDIDILIVREEPTLLERHIKVCEENNLCYSNTTQIDDRKTRGDRMTGLHFFKRREYLEKTAPIMQKYQKILAQKNGVSIFTNKVAKRIDDQHALYVVIKEAGLPLPSHSFFEYHGLHLGHSRCPGRWDLLFQEKLHREYFKGFHKVIDGEFWHLYENTIPEIREEIDIMIKSGRRNVET